MYYISMDSSQCDEPEFWLPSILNGFPTKLNDSDAITHLLPPSYFGSESCCCMRKGRCQKVFLWHWCSVEDIPSRPSISAIPPPPNLLPGMSASRLHRMPVRDGGGGKGKCRGGPTWGGPKKWGGRGLKMGYIEYFLTDIDLSSIKIKLLYCAMCRLRSY